MRAKFDINTENVETVDLYSDEPHYRIIKHDGEAKVANVQGFDYYDYEQFIGIVCFVHESDALKVAKTINKVGIKYFV